MIAGKLGSFWEQTPDPQFGDNFTRWWPDGELDNYVCHKDGCEISYLHFDYLDAEKRNPTSAEWRDSEGNLKLAAYYDYQIDAYGNWTRRAVSVWSPSLGERKLYETDSREIEYWQP